MRVSHNWLRQYVDLKLEPQELADGLSMLGLEVESFESQAKQYDKFVVGKVVEKKKHPNADKLSVCLVDIGKEQLQIVCGGPNVEAGQKVAVGLVGAIVPRNQHDPDGEPFVLGQVKIRGVESSGMICSEFELGLGPDAESILVLDAKAKVGASLAEYLDKTDVLYEMEVTANRGDWLSHIGVAREVSALTGKQWKTPKVNIKERRERTEEHASVRIDDHEGCPRYAARVVLNVTIGPSPQWLQDRLQAVGVRPISNVVDVTNYVLMETGHPLHAFDLDKLAGHKIIVRRAKENEKFTTLDEKERTLGPETLLICDAQKPVAIAGVMGGINSEISRTTKNVLLESAFFDPKSIRRTSKFLGLSTEASQRFERSADIEMVVFAINRAAQLLADIAGGEVLKGVIDVYPKKMKKKTTRLRTARTNQILGTNLKSSEIKKLLGRFGFKCISDKKDVFRVTIPSYRNDVTSEIDLIEEVARLFGYDNIETKTRGMIDYSEVSGKRDFSDEVLDYWVGAGFNECIANSLLNRKEIDIVGEPAVDVLNPVSVDMAALRTSLIPGMLRIVQNNIYQTQRDLRLFEIGRVYMKKEEISPDLLAPYFEEDRLIIILTGYNSPAQYGMMRRNFDLFDLKGEVETFLSKFFLDKYCFIYYDTHKPLSVSNIDIEINGTYVGFLGKVKKEILNFFDISQDVYVCELMLEKLSDHLPKGRRFLAVTKFPTVTRDVAFVVGQDLRFADLERVIRQAGGKDLKGVTLFDVYEGDQVGQNKKSMACTIEIQSPDKTLNESEINTIVQRIVERAKGECGATLRA